MPIRVKCEQCKKTLSVKDHLAGKKIKCPVCQNPVVVSASAAPKTPAGDAPKAPAPAPAAKKPTPVAKPAATAVKAPANGKKPAAAAPADSNGKKPAEPETPESNGRKPHEAAPPAPPSEEVEAEAAALFADEPPKEAEEAPQNIEFKCEWCDEMVSFTIDMAGKRAQCPNQECRRIVKVPLPKVEGKKDWRKMDRVGPAAALVNQPEQLENAWGTENTTKARQDSLAKAGAVDLPPPPPLGVVGWLRYFVLASLFFSVIGGVIVGAAKLMSGNAQVRDIELLKSFVIGRSPRITNPLLAAETHCTIGLMYLQDGKTGVTRPADRALEHFQGARALLAVPGAGKEVNVHEPMQQIEIAIAAISMGGSEEEWIEKTKQKWRPTIGEYLNASVEALKSPELQAMAIRDISTRLLERDASKKNQADIALGLAGGRSKKKDKMTTVFGQEVALLVAEQKDGELKNLEAFKDPADQGILKDVKEAREIHNPYLRVGFAEGFARRGEWDVAIKLLDIKGGEPRDRLEACLGVTSIAWSAGKMDKAKEALDLIKDYRQATQWQLLHLAKLAARAEHATLDDAKTRLQGPFLVRAHLEIFRAKCDRAASPVSPELLSDIEASDKDITLTLAWYYLAQQHARKGQKRPAIQKTLEDHLSVGERGELDKLRPIVEVGAMRGMLR